MKNFFEQAAQQHHPMRTLKDFLESESANETAKKYEDMRFVGYVLDINYDSVVIITSDPFKIAVGGVPRNSLLIMTPSVQTENITPHFTLLRVLDAAPTPLSKDTQQTFFELQKRSMPELDIFTQSELQWGALNTEVLGMYYPHPEKQDTIEFAGDMNNFVSAHKYRVFSPDDALLDLVINTLVPIENRFSLGKLRLTESRLPLPDKKQPNVNIQVSTRDFMASRTAMFGKTRLGKSNVVKLIAQSLIETTKKTKNVGQLIFDINGEYANDNPQDGNLSLRSAYEKDCIVYALSPKGKTNSRPLKLDFYEHPDRSLRVLSNLLVNEGRTAIYVGSFRGVSLPTLADIQSLPQNEKLRAQRKILMYWAILHKAGFPSDPKKLKTLLSLDPGFSKEVRQTVYGNKTPPKIDTLDALINELEDLIDVNRQTPFKSASGNLLFDADDIALLGFLKPTAGAGVKMIQRYRIYHDPKAGDFITDIIVEMDKGQTIILDLGNADEEVMRYFSEELASAVLYHQVDKFTENKLGDHYMQLYFEEAHNLFPVKEDDSVDIYRRLAKEGAKYHVGMVYSTQSVTSINRDLLSQTENFFVAHMSSLDEVTTLAKMNVAFSSMKDDILRAKTPGYMRMLTRSHRFVVSVQANKFDPNKKST
ncbi:MAG: ATP-binding protein [Anaerolineae bacterium]|nr:ATP-binding protein [Anaerolineae bacterium]